MDAARPGSELISGVRVWVPFGVGKVMESAPGRGCNAALGAHNPVEEAPGFLGAAASFSVVDSQAEASFGV